LSQANSNNRINSANMTNTANDNSTLISPSLAIPTAINNSTANQMATVAANNNNSNNQSSLLQQQQQQQQPHVKDITINVRSKSYSPNKIEVNKGDLVRLHFITANDEVSLYNGHGFGIDGYNINTFLVKGTQQTLQFIADKPGTFMFRCTSFCAFPHADTMNHFNMIGSFIVHG